MLIRQPLLSRLQRFKGLQFSTLLNLVDNYAPLTLSIYSVYFNANADSDYVRVLKQVWERHFTFDRRHYEEAPVVWISQIAYWKATSHPLHTTMADNPHILDDYPVEKFHSLLRARTNDWDTPKEIQRKARLIDANNQDLQQFATHFVPQRNAMMNQNQL